MKEETLIQYIKETVKFMKLAKYEAQTIDNLCDKILEKIESEYPEPQEQEKSCDNCATIFNTTRMLCGECYNKSNWKPKPPKQEPEEWKPIFLTEWFDKEDIAEVAQNNTAGIQLCLNKIKALEERSDSKDE